MPTTPTVGRDRSTARLRSDRRTSHVLTTAHLAHRRNRSGESGAVILLALAFLTVVLTLVVALFGLSHTGSASLRHFRFERVRRYNADAALQAAVQYVKQNPRVGEGTGTGALTQCLTYDMQEDVSGNTGAGEIQSVLTPGSTLRVYCGATNGVSSGITGYPSSGFDTDQGQPPRDVTIEVRCTGNPPTPRGRLTCGSTGSTTTVLARARVRFDVDWGITPTAPDCGPIDLNPLLPDGVTPNPHFLVNDCYASTARAVVPKVVYWSIRG